LKFQLKNATEMTKLGINRIYMQYEEKGVYVLQMKLEVIESYMYV